MRILSIILVIATLISSVAAAPLPTRSQMRAEFDEKKRQVEFEMRRQQREFMEQQKEMERARTKPTSSNRIPYKSSVTPPRTQTTTTSRTRPPAQSPAQATATFIKRARGASSMNQLIGLMSSQRQKQLRERESSYDPKTARESVDRMARLLERPLTTEEKLQFGSSPFANELRQLKQIAGKAISIKSESLNESGATVTVWAHNLAGDPTYRYGLGMFRFVAEGGTWKFDSYEDSGSFFSEME